MADLANALGSGGEIRSFSEGRWAVEAVMSVQTVMAPFDDVLSFVSSASNPASVLHYLVPVLALFDQGLALRIVVSYVVADISNLAMKWPAQGDRPYWMDSSVRQFGHNTCEVGFGMPSGHVQVTVAVYALLAVAIGKRWFTALIAALVGVTALSRVHMGAHTLLQVSCGAVAGIVTAFLVHRASPAIQRWANRDFGSVPRIAYAMLTVGAAACFIASECQLLTWLGVDIYASVAKATAACREGIGASVSSARGVARDCAALVGAAIGRSFVVALRPKHTLVSAAAAAPAYRRRGWVTAVQGGVCAWAALEATERGASALQHQLTQPSMDDNQAEWLAVAVQTVKYVVLLTIGMGFVPAALASPRSSLLSETDLSVHEREKALL